MQQFTAKPGVLCKINLRLCSVQNQHQQVYVRFPPLPLSSSTSPPSLTLLEVRSKPPSISPFLESSLSSSQLHCTYIHQFLEGSVPPCYPDRAPFQFPPANPSSILTSHDHPKASPIRSLEGPRAPYPPRLPPSARPPASRSPATRAGVRALQPQKRGRAKLQSVLKTSDTGYPDLLQYQPTSSSYGCLSSLKKKRSRGNMPRAVGNRTPRLTVASKYQRDDNIRPANRRAKPNGTNGDDEGAHVAVLALAVVCQRGGSPQVSQIPRRSSYHKTSALDALHTLANRSVNILQPSSSAVTELSAHIKGSKDNESSEKPSVPAAVPLFKKNVNSSKKKKINRLSEIASNDMVTRKNARLMKDPDHDGSTISEVVEQQDPHHDGSAISEVEALDNMDTTQNALSQNSDSMSKARSQHTLGILKALAPECKPSEGADDSCDNFTYPVNSIVDLKDKPSHCLSSRPPRRWCMSEWCCTAIDYPWFAKSDFFAEYPKYVKLGQESAKSEFVEYPNHVKLGHGPKLARVEWGVIRSSFGKPRRFSKQFLKEEREKLSQYRESVGQHYAELQSGVREGLPRAIACHPQTRELPDGSVLTVDRDRCRVLQIDDGSELTRGFEFVMGTNMQREVTHLRQKIMCEVNSSRVNIRDLPGYLLANEW